MDDTKIQDDSNSNNMQEISDSVLDKSCIKGSSNVSVAGTESTEGSCQEITSEASFSGSGSDYAKYPNVTFYTQPDIGCIPVKPSVTRLNDLLPQTLRQKDIEVYETNFDEVLKHLFRQAINADAKISIGSKEFPCHLVLLQSYSKYFQRIKRPPETVYRLELPEVA
ncbi:unnamed protein product [Allacma fusca]|uniref:BTB domain-containing protein n=1 Tax=Allacma fusca TaxID=39272 RepID=A0A8J2P4V8_9HEXA|nr:unnamed protein product [Allacma fusca]